jgi:hypothetical protein
MNILKRFLVSPIGRVHFLCLAKENRTKRKATLLSSPAGAQKFTQIKGRLYVASMQQSALIQRRVGLPLYLGKIFS